MWPLATHIVGHLGRYLQRELHKASNLVGLVPRSLVDELAQWTLLYGVGVILAIGDKTVDDLARTTAMAWHHRTTLHVAIDIHRTLILVQNNAIEVADGDGTGLK